MNHEPVPIETDGEAQQKYLAKACDALAGDASGLAATRTTFENPADHVILPEIISREPLGPVVPSVGEVSEEPFRPKDHGELGTDASQSAQNRHRGLLILGL